MSDNKKFGGFYICDQCRQPVPSGLADREKAIVRRLEICKTKTSPRWVVNDLLSKLISDIQNNNISGTFQNGTNHEE